MNITINAVPFYVENCYSCHIAFAIPRSLYGARQADGKTFYCPNGHGQCYSKPIIKQLEEEKAKITENRDWWKKRVENEQRAADHMTRRYNGLLGQLARARRKR